MYVFMSGTICARACVRWTTLPGYHTKSHECSNSYKLDQLSWLVISHIMATSKSRCNIRAWRLPFLLIRSLPIGPIGYCIATTQSSQSAGGARLSAAGIRTREPPCSNAASALAGGHDMWYYESWQLLEFVSISTWNRTRLEVRRIPKRNRMNAWSNKNSTMKSHERCLIQ